MNIIKDRRLGRFRVSIDLLNEMTAEERRALFGAVIVWKAEILGPIDQVEYTAVCAEFALVGEGDLIPQYTPWFKRNDDGSVELQEWR
jgi:hypothetical protein